MTKVKPMSCSRTSILMHKWKEHIDYAFISTTSDEHDSGVNDPLRCQILRGPFKGVVFHFGKLSCGEVEEENMKLSFEYTIDNLNGNQAPVENEKEFVEMLGDILVEMISS